MEPGNGAKADDGQGYRIVFWAGEHGMIMQL